MAAGRLSGLTTTGRSVLAAGMATAMCAVVVDERDLLTIGIFVTALPLLALLLTARVRRSVRVERTIAPDRVPVGTPAEVSIELAGGPLLATLRVADAVPDSAGPLPGSPPRFAVHRLPVRTGIRLSYPLRPVLRGSHRIGPLVGRVNDPLGLAEFPRELRPAEQLLVLPAIVGLRGMPPALGGRENTPGPAVARHHGHGAPEAMIRPYRPGDELRRVHWRSTARHDELMVRLEEPPRRGQITVLLDRRDAAHRGRGAESSLEFAVSLAASICAHLTSRGEPVTLVTEDGLQPVGADAGLDPMLDALAAVRPSARAGLAGSPLAATDIVAVLGALEPNEIEELLARRSSGGNAVLLDVRSWDPASRSATPAPDQSAAALRRAGWHVVVVAADSTPDRAWAELTGGPA
ncbi:DUF58 domain-containing protein [Pseudonocardia asaccharolytica]|uniref:DUF58 domain-containing protein n=1 Tax=Pseudonocardia asaccharolytica DSM 44247 = NBRC 16224 TaxID=1123024 RepID=A0A511CXJ3_9PSEU|nr:DUF58 domain-containing protein [Pseudonocardia asaccharolytica]GEL17197.1 hypothetical protein PA7_10340 [Pseudonocardia asaccharolytica DSM 44247 = NBRC 16224]